MAVHMLVVGKLKLLGAGGAAGHGNWKLLATLLCPFALKLPFALHLPSSCSDLALSLRLFLFRLNRIVFEGIGDGGGRRWERALRLFHERAAGARADHDALHAVSMIAL